LTRMTRSRLAKLVRLRSLLFFGEIGQVCRHALSVGINRNLNRSVHNTDMRVAGTIIVALLALQFVDEQYNEGRYSRAATMMLSHITKSFS
jgi:hypothetical protein